MAVPQISERAEALVEQFIELVSHSPEEGSQSDMLFAQVCEKDPELAPLAWALLREICPLLLIPLPPPPIAPIDPRGDRGDRFRFHGVIGVGGMGEVSECYDPELGRSVAIKWLRSDETADACSDETNRIPVDAETRAQNPAERHVWRQALLIREAAITSHLDHPGIVQIYEIGRHSQNGLYYTMRLVGGDNLLTVIESVHKQSGGWDRKRAISAIVKVCRAIAHAHERGVIHRDLKPNNIRVEHHDDACVIDWGLACWTRQQRRMSAVLNPMANEPTPSPSRQANQQGGPTIDAKRVSVIDLGSLLKGAVVGTPDYMAPEQARGASSPRADVYSIGAILYHLLANRKPLVGAKDEVLTLLRQEQLLAPPELPAECPAELAAICRKAMASDPNHRYAAVSELAAELQNWLDLKVVDAYSYAVKPLSALAKWCRRNPAYAALVVAVIVLGTTVTFLAPGAIEESRSQDRLERGEDVSRFFHRNANDESFATGESAALWWPREARRLTADADLGLSAFQAYLDELRVRATRQSDVFGPVRGSKYEALMNMLDRKRGESVWRARMLRKEAWLPPGEVERQAARLQVPLQWAQLNGRAFDLINPDSARKDYGFEQCAVYLAEQAVTLAANHHERSRSLDTLACALTRAGLFEAARTCQAKAVAAALAHFQAAPAVKASDELGNINGPDDWYRTIIENQRWVERECQIWSSPEEERRYEILVDEIRDLEWLTTAFGYRSGDVALEVRRSQLEPIVFQLRALDRRLRFVAEASAADGDRRWRDAIEAIAANPKYGQRRISPQLDLFPLGADPNSGLQEFVFLPSGLAPTREIDGALAMTRNSGMVMVLIPGVDGGEPFFLSKWELSNAQWARIAGWWPHEERDTVSMLPVTGFRLSELERLIDDSCSELRVPMHSEWLHACRAGRRKDWFGRETEASASRFATFRWEGASESIVGIQDLNTIDGTKSPNDFGLFDMVGNVFEVVAIDAKSLNGLSRGGKVSLRPVWGHTGGTGNMRFAQLRKAALSDHVVESAESCNDRGCRLARSLMR